MKNRIFLPFYSLAAVIILVGLACGLPPKPSSPTKTPLFPIQNQLTQPPVIQNLPTIPPVVVQPTNPPPPTDTPVPTPNPTSTPDVDSSIKSAKILLYEDTVWEGLWVKAALDDAGYSYYMSKGTGDFMNKLASKWDLVIIAAEERSAVSGEFWDVLVPMVNNGTALIYETWTLSTQGQGKVKQLLDGCGVEFQYKVNSALPIIYYAPDHEVFTHPNQISEIRVAQYWTSDNINLVKLANTGDAQILGGTDLKDHSSFGVITTCYGGRVILSTFSNHDYKSDDVKALWQNYVYFTLKNHFLNR
jgi:hypothetical protein